MYSAMERLSDEQYTKLTALVVETYLSNEVIK